MRLIYKLAVEPIILYGASIWGKLIRFGKTVRLLRSFQRLAGLCITGGLRTSSTVAVLRVAGLEPLDDLIRRRASKFYIGVCGQPPLCTIAGLEGHLWLHDSYPGHDSTLQWLAVTAGLCGFRTSSCLAIPSPLQIPSGKIGRAHV